MPETPEQFWERVHAALRTPPLDEWDTWPFVGLPEPRKLAPPQGADKPRHGEGGVGVRVQRAIYAIGDIGNVHVLRIGDGSEHCHIWFMARPKGIHQLQSGFVQIWDDVLPPLPEDVWRANLEIVARELNR